VFSPVLLLGVVAAYVLSMGRVRLLGLLVQPRWLAVFVAAGLVVLAWRLFAVLDAAWLEGRRRGPADGLARVLVLLVVVGVILPHVVMTAYGLRTIRLLDAVFVAAPAAPASGDALPPPVTVPGSSPATSEPDSSGPGPDLATAPPAPPQRNLLFRDGVGDPDAVGIYPEIVAGYAPPPFVPFEERVGVDRITVLLAGGDAGPGRSGLRTDTMIVATLDTTTGKAALFGIPRNLAQVPLPRRFDEAFVGLEQRLAPPPSSTTTTTPPETTTTLPGGSTTTVPGESTTTTTTTTPPFVSCRCFPDQLNALYPYARKLRRTFPNAVDPGMEALRQTLQKLLGLHIDYYALVDMAGFVALVDAVGGVDVEVTQPLHAEVSPPVEGAPWATVDVQPGRHHLSGTEALAYARARKHSSDYVRMQRQRCLLRALAAEVDPFTLLRSFPAIADAIESSVVTDIPLGFLPDLIEAAASLDLGDIVTVGLVPPYYAPTRDAKNHPVPDVGRIRSKVRRVLAGERQADRSAAESECEA